MYVCLVALTPLIVSPNTDRYIKEVYDDKGPCSDLCGLFSDGRREAGEAYMSKLTIDEIDEAHLLTVLGTPPVLADGTKFTAIMSVANNNHYRTVVRHYNSDDSNEELTKRNQQRLRIFLEALTGLDVSDDL